MILRSGLMAGLVALIGGLFALGIGIGAVMAALAPFAVLLLILLTPFLLIVWILQKVGIVKSRRGATLVFLLLLLLAGGAIRVGWAEGIDGMHQWVDGHRQMIEQCQDGRHHEFDMGWFHFSCGENRRKPQGIDT